MHTIVIAAGGTGGHIFPAQVLAEKLLKKGCKVHLIHDQRATKIMTFPTEVINYEISLQNFNGSIFAKCKALFKLIVGIIKTFIYFKKTKPDVIVGFGGYPSFPALAAGSLLCITLMTHEQNYVLGRVNRFFLPYVKMIATGFPDLLKIKQKYEDKIIYVGNPVRSEFHNLKRKKKKKFVIAIIGGSQGSRILAQTAPQALKLLPEKLQKKLIVYQQAHSKFMDEVHTLYQGVKFDIMIKDFFINIAQILNESDLVIARSGASTTSELMFLGKPSIMIPLPYATDQHQLYHAKFLEEHKAGWLIEEKNFTAASLAIKIEELMNNKELLASMAKNAKSLSIEDSGDRLSKIVISAAQNN